MEGAYEYISADNVYQELEKLITYINDEEYDSDSVQYDISDYSHCGNIQNNINSNCFLSLCNYTKNNERMLYILVNSTNIDHQKLCI